MDSSSITTSLWDNPERYWQKGMFTLDRILCNTHGIRVWKERWPDPDSGAVANGLAGWSGTWKEHDSKTGEENFWGRSMARSLQMSKGCEDTCVPCECSSKGDLS